MPGRGRSEDYLMLDEFVCTATPAAGMVPPGPRGRGANPDMHVVAEVAPVGPPAPIPADRVADLRARSTDELLHLIRQSGPSLSGGELVVIHDIAAERMRAGTGPDAAGALSREAMLLAISRSA